MTTPAIPHARLYHATEQATASTSTTNSNELVLIGENATPSRIPTKKIHSARIEHRVPGRMRIKIPSAKNNSEMLNLFKAVFCQLPGICDIKVNPATGSIVIHYDQQREAEFQAHFHHSCLDQNVVFDNSLPGNEIDKIANQIEVEASFLAEQSEALSYVVDFFKNLDYQIRAVTDNKLDLKVVIVGSVAAFTFVEIGAEAATPMWVTLALFSLNHFIELKHEVARNPAAYPIHSPIQ